MKNVFWFDNLNSIGGVETFFYYLARKYNDWDINIVYSDGDSRQVERLGRYIRIIKWDGTDIECDRFFGSYSTNILDHVKAKFIGWIIHTDYEYSNFAPPHSKRIDKYFGVSKTACDSFTKITGLQCTCVYNPLFIEPQKKVLHLISASRLTDRNKGAERMEYFSSGLNRYCKMTGRHYLWTIFTNDTNAIPNPNIIYMKPQIDILPYIAESDFLVQLSDNGEGYNYSVNEALSLGTPVVITPCTVYDELGIDDTMSIRLNFNLDNEQEVINKMFTQEFKFKYKAPEDRWKEFLKPGASTYL